MLDRKLNLLLILTFLGINQVFHVHYHSKLDFHYFYVYFSFSNCFYSHFSCVSFSLCLLTQYHLVITLIYLFLQFHDRLHIHQVSLPYHQHIYLAPVGNLRIILDMLFIKNYHHKNCFSSLKSFVLLSIV